MVLTYIVNIFGVTDFVANITTLTHTRRKVKRECSQSAFSVTNCESADAIVARTEC